MSTATPTLAKNLLEYDVNTICVSYVLRRLHWSFNFHPCVICPFNSSPAFSTPAIWSV